MGFLLETYLVLLCMYVTLVDGQTNLTSTTQPITTTTTTTTQPITTTTTTTTTTIPTTIPTTTSATYGDGSVHAAFEVFCDGTDLVVYFNKTALDGRTISNFNNRTYKIAFDQTLSPACVVTANDASNVDQNAKDTLPKPIEFTSSIFLTASFDACGIVVVSDKTDIIYKQAIVVTYGSNPNPNVIREEKDIYDVMCLLNRTAQLKAGFNSTKYRTDGSDSKNATSTFGLTLKHTDINDVKQPVYKLGQFIKFTLSSPTLQSGAKAVIQKCWSSDGSSNEYVLIDNRCDLEPGSSFIDNPTNISTEWKTEAFRYSSTHSLYVECIVRICLDGDTSPQCTLCSVSNKRRRRSTEIETAEIAFVKSGSFIVIEKEKLAPSSNQKQESTSFLAGTSGIVVVALLAAIVILISAAIIRKVCCVPPLGALTRSRCDSDEEDVTKM